MLLPVVIAIMAEQIDQHVANLTASEHESDVDEAISENETVVNVVSTRRPFRLLDLPLELRLIIFRHLLFQPQGINIGDYPWLPSSRSRFDLAIFRTCRLIREETYQVFYGENQFNNFLGSRADPIILDGFDGLSPFPQLADRIQNMHIEVNIRCQLLRSFTTHKFLHFMPHLGDPSFLHGTLVVDFSEDCRSAKFSSFLKWFARALGRFTNFRTVKLIFDRGFLNRVGSADTFDPARYFKLALEPVLGRAEDVTPGRNDGLRFHPVDHLNRSRGSVDDDGDWADLLGGVRLEWNDDSAHSDDSKMLE